MSTATDQQKFFGVPIKNTKTIVFFWLILTILTHIFYLNNLPVSNEAPSPEAAYYEQLAISTRQLFFLVLFIYSAMRVIFPALPIWTTAKSLLSMSREHPLAAATVVLGLCVVLAGAIIGGGSAITKSY